MPSILFILLLALVIFGPRKLLHAATNMAPGQHPWQKLMSLMTAATDTAEPRSPEQCSEEPERNAPASVEPLSPVTAHGDSE
jgi:Sec-independent protein translocase protein TatA